MKKKIKVEMCICTCAECPYYNEMCECEQNWIEIRDPSHIPEWCPLEDAE